LFWLKSLCKTKKEDLSLGQKVNPIGLRLGIVKTWESRWYSDKKYSEYILEDHKIRKFIKKKLNHAGISKIEIERSAKRIRLRIFTARPGIVIGKKGAEIELLKKELEKMVSQEVSIDIQEIRKPEINAQLIAENVALQIERRVAFRRAMKRGVSSAMRFGALGIKIICAGRLGGAEMARTEWYREGRVPLHTLRADIDYGFTEANTTYGIIGVKVFVFHGEILKKDQVEVGAR
jgi:small subunit ribosomal protein S3